MEYVLLLRGINVGGKNIVKMAVLRDMLTQLGCTGVQTYIQSGNVILQSNLTENALLDLIRPAFLAAFGFDCGMLLRDAAVMRALAAALPFTAENVAAAQSAAPDVEHLYVYFLEQPLSEKASAAARSSASHGDSVHAASQEVYLLCLDSIRLCKTAQALGKLFPSATVRNWKTVQKLSSMLTM